MICTILVIWLAIFGHPSLGQASADLHITSSVSFRLMQNRAKLTLSKIKQLIQNRTPDAVIAGEIQEKGIAFRVSQTTLADLRNLGAGPETIKLLSSYLTNQPKPPNRENPPTSNSNREAQIRIDAEVRNRLDDALWSLQKEKDRLEQGQGKGRYYHRPEEFSHLIVDGLDGNYRKNVALYPEFKGKNFLMLINELKNVVNPAEKSELDKVIRVYNDLRSEMIKDSGYTWRVEDTINPEWMLKSLEAANKAMKIFKEDLLIPRWKNTER